MATSHTVILSRYKEQQQRKRGERMRRKKKGRQWPKSRPRAKFCLGEIESDRHVHFFG
jgi:hypothetical protein